MKSKYDKIQQIISNMKQPDYRYLQITNEIFRLRTGEFKSMSILPVKLRKVLTDNNLFALSRRRIAISTIGALPGIYRLTQDFPKINLTFSLHSPFNDQRSKLMPVNDLLPLQEVMKALDNHIRRTGRMGASLSG